MERGNTGPPCGQCGLPHGNGHPYIGGSICDPCWQERAATITSKLGDLVREVFPGAGAVVASRAIASALPTIDSRIQAWFDLHVMTGPSRRGTSRMTSGVAQLMRELHELGVPGKMNAYRGLRRVQHQVREKAPCTECGNFRQIAGRIQGAGLCASCWQRHPAIVRPCVRCGDVEYLSWSGLCKQCRAADRLAELFTTERLTAHPELAGARDALTAADGRYLARAINRPTWKLLCQVITGSTPIDHDAIDALGPPSTTRLLRAFLVDTGVLPPRDERLRSLEKWIEETAASIVVAADRRAFTRFARWRHLRRSRTEPMSVGQLSGRQQELRQVHHLIAWLHDHDLTLGRMTQRHLEQWLAPNTGPRLRIGIFIRWCHTSSINRTLDPPPRRRSSAMLTTGISETLRLELLQSILDPDIDLAAELRLAASLVLLYGIRLHHIAKLPSSSVVTVDGLVTISVGDDPLILPEPLAAYALDAASPSTIVRFGGPTEDRDWLFPSHLPGDPISAATLGRRLRRIGVEPGAARNTALVQLALQLPPAVLGRLIGVRPRTATRWNVTIAASQARYATSRVQG